MEQIKNSKGDVLPRPYLDLARMRREQLIDSDWVIMFWDDFKENQKIEDAFRWSDTVERHDFWGEVNNGQHPDIPAASLAELEHWRKAKGIAELQPAEPDWKAMYEGLRLEANELTAALKELGAKYDELKAGDPDRNWVAECAMAAMQGLFSNEAVRQIYAANNGLYSNEIITVAWDYAESWAAEGVKRGHLPNNQK